MTSANAMNCVVYRLRSVPRKSLNINLSLSSRGLLSPKVLLCGSAGHVSQEAVRRYINEQQLKDVFEYNVFGSPNQKIGDFTQTKIGGFV